MGVVAACAINEPPRHSVHIGALAHAVQMGARHLVMTRKTELHQLRIQQFRLSSGVGHMAGIASHLRGGMLDLLRHHFPAMAIVAELWSGLRQKRLCRTGVRGVTAQALSAGEGWIVARFSLHGLFCLFVTVPAEVGDLFDEFRRPLRFMAGCARPRRVRTMLDGMQQRLGPSMGVVTARAVGLCHFEAVMLRLQGLRVVTLPAEFRRGLSE